MKTKTTVEAIKKRLVEGDLKSFKLKKGEIALLYETNTPTAKIVLQYAALADLLRKPSDCEVRCIYDFPSALFDPKECYESEEDVPDECFDEDKPLEGPVYLEAPTIHFLKEMARRFKAPGLALLETFLTMSFDTDFWTEPYGFGFFEDEYLGGTLTTAALQKAVEDCKRAYAAGKIPPPFPKEKPKAAKRSKA